jgi:hypothetical protein
MKGGCTRRLYSTNHLKPYAFLTLLEQCSLNTHRDDRLCDYFVWRDDLRITQPPESESKRKPCSAVTCKRIKPRAAHRMCIRGFCKECCREAAKFKLSDELFCKAPKHKLTTDTPGPVQSSSGFSQSSAPASLVPAGPFGRMLSPLYAQKLAQTFSPATDPDLRGKYRKENAVSIRVLWWTEVRCP